jgi:hypothetical protein|tara:strand:+ start:4045 stop:4386 length:342 start_codon:yes stop_codon:yes gene_type:complete
VQTSIKEFYAAHLFIIDEANRLLWDVRVRVLSDFFDFLEVLFIIMTVLSILYYLFTTAYKQLFQKKINDKTLSNEEGSGLLGVWKKIPFPMKILLVTVDLGVLLALLYYFGAI